MNSYVLVLLFMLSNGNVHVAHEGVGNATRLSKDSCEIALATRLEQAKHVHGLLWVAGMCKEVPDAPMDLKELGGNT